MTELEKKVFREVFVNKPIMFHSDDCLLKIRDFFEKFSVGYLDFQTGYTHNVIMLNDNLNAYYLNSFNICDRKYNFDLLLQDYKETIRRKKMNKDFKVGDVLVMINAKNSWQESSMVINKDLFEVVLVHSDNDFDLKQLRSDKIFTLRSHEKQDFRHATLKEQYLRSGNVVVNNANRVYIVINDYMARVSGYYNIEDLDDDLNHKIDDSYSIKKVYKIENKVYGNGSLRFKDLSDPDYEEHKLIWERKPKIKLTDDEVVILKNVDANIVKIFRDKSNRLTTIDKDKNMSVFYFNDLFQDITFESGSHLIADLIKENEK